MKKHENGSNREKKVYIYNHHWKELHKVFDSKRKTKNRA